MSTGVEIQATSPRDDEGLGWGPNLRVTQRVPLPKYRHAAPSAPWPWMDLIQDDAEVKQLAPGADEDWTRYPQNRFGNWTPDQVQRSRMFTVCKDEYLCRIHRVDTFTDGSFGNLGEEEQNSQITSKEQFAVEFWKDLKKPVMGLRVRVLFIENITLIVLKMLGVRYDIEPFFFASCANWIPSRYQENPVHGEGDHITIVLPFICVVKNHPRHSNLSGWASSEKGSTSNTEKKRKIDTQAPLVLSENRILLQDLLAIHMVRNRECNTIISYHHHSDLKKTTARRLRSLVQRTGDSVYWQKLYDKSKDPTFVVLAVLWYAFYAWDEVLEVLYWHCKKLEANITNVKASTNHTKELHMLQARLLHYEQPLSDLRKSVEFVRDTHNPAMDDHSISDLERENSKRMLTLESEKLLGEIQRLEEQRRVQSGRLKNAMTLAFWTIKLEESKDMQQLAKTSLVDSAAMKLISYMTVIFLPAHFLSSVFGLDLHGITVHVGRITLTTYVGCTAVLTLTVTWAIVAMQSESRFHPGGPSIVRRVAWPVFHSYELSKKMVNVVQEWRRRW